MAESKYLVAASPSLLRGRKIVVGVVFSFGSTLIGIVAGRCGIGVVSRRCLDEFPEAICLVESKGKVEGRNRLKPSDSEDVAEKSLRYGNISLPRRFA